MTLLELLNKRRSVRQFLDKEVEQEKIDAILSGALTAPSSRNTRSSRFAVVTNRELLGKISGMRDYGAAFLANVPMAVIVMGEESSTDLWRENCSISSTIVQLMAESLGLVSCWVHVCGRPQKIKNPEAGTAEEYVHDLLPATRPYRVHSIIAVGYPEIEPRPHTHSNDSDKIILL